MKVSVCTSISYWYEVDIPDDTPAEDILDVVDTEDPVYSGISRILHETASVVDYDANTISVVSDDGRSLYEL